MNSVFNLRKGEHDRLSAVYVIGECIMGNLCMNKGGSTEILQITVYKNGYTSFIAEKPESAIERNKK